MAIVIYDTVNKNMLNFNSSEFDNWLSSNAKNRRSVNTTNTYPFININYNN